VTIQLLTTKLHRPPVRPDLAARPRLIGRLDAGLDAGGKLSLLAAPAGSGKTTLVSQWLQQRQLPSAWLSLDERDNEPDRFLNYVAAALRQIGVKVGQIDLSLPLAGWPPFELLLTALINDIAAAPHNFILVLDDFHTIDAGLIHQLLDFLIEHQPAQMHLVLTTRADPALNLSRLRVRGQITEIGAADLKFSQAEVSYFFNELLGFDLRPDQLALLESRTEGWIAGLQLAALSMRGQPDLHDFIASFSGDDRYLLAYLTEEVLSRQPETNQTFLRRTSLLPRLCGPLCDSLLPELLQGQTGQQMLEALERQHLFIIPLDNKRGWYRYHQVFADFLYHQLNQTEPDRIPLLHRRAALWFEQHGLVEEAIDHTLAAQDFEHAAVLIEGHFEPMLRRNETSRLISWLRQLPQTLHRTRPLLPLAWAWLNVVQAQFDQAEAWVQKTEAALLDTPVDPDTAAQAPGLSRQALAGHIAAIRATVAINLGYGPDQVISLARQALHHLPPDNALLRAVTMLNLGDAYAARHDLEAARQAFIEAVLLGQEAGYPSLVPVALGSQGILSERQGELGQAAEIYRQALAAAGAEQGDAPTPSAGKAYVFLARVLYEWNDLAAALQHAQTGLDCCQRWGHLGHLFDGYLQLIQIYHARQAPAEAHTALAAARLLLSQAATAANRAVQPVPNHKLVQMTDRLTALELALALKQGQREPVKQWAQSSQPDRPEFQLIWPRFWLAQGRFGQAAQRLSLLRQEAETNRQTNRLIKIVILETAALQGQGDTVAARAALAQTLPLAEAGGYLRSFVDESPPVLELLGQVLHAVPASAYTARLLAALKTGQLPSAAGLLPEPLSEREREVLRLIALNLSNQEIAAQLVVSPNTVKTHLKRLYAKLDVHNRFEAIEQGRRLGLL